MADQADLKVTGETVDTHKNSVDGRCKAERMEYEDKKREERPTKVVNLRNILDKPLRKDKPVIRALTPSLPILFPCK